MKSALIPLLSVLCLIYLSDISSSHEEISLHNRIRRASSPADFSKNIVDKHNALRRLQGATNMFEMQWDASLAQAAVEWTSRCNVNHGFPTDKYPLPSSGQPGENIYVDTASSLDEVGAVQSWYDEIDYYDFSGPCSSNAPCGTCASGKTCLHYTQLVWWNSVKIGCGYTNCPKVTGLVTWNTPTNFLICYYSPGGNIVYQYPFMKGTACTQCGSNPSDYSCDNGLCVTGPLPTSPTTSNTSTTGPLIPNSSTSLSPANPGDNSTPKQQDKSTSGSGNGVNFPDWAIGVLVGGLALVAGLAACLCCCMPKMPSGSSQTIPQPGYYVRRSPYSGNHIVPRSAYQYRGPNPNAGEPWATRFNPRYDIGPPVYGKM